MIIADENIDAAIIKSLREQGIDALSIRENYTGITDAEVIEIAKDNDRVILTEDKDFGEWVFARKEINISVILLRYFYKERYSILNILLTYLKDNINELSGKFVTLTPHKIRVRRI